MKLEIPFPCSEDIDQMNPSGSGRFCGACDKVIIDFTKMSLPEIQSYFLNHKDEKTCGIFNQETIIAQEYSIPLEIIQQNYNRWKNLFILAFAVAFGFLSFGCGEEKKVENSNPSIPVFDTLNRGKVGMIYTIDSSKSLKYCSDKEIKNHHKIEFITTTGILVNIDTNQISEETILKEDTVNQPELVMGKVISNPAIIKKPNIKRKTEHIFDNSFIDSIKKTDIRDKSKIFGDTIYSEPIF